MKASVIIAARNAEKTLARAIRSAIGQTLNSLEVIVVDDGSSDRTASIVSQLAQADQRVSLIRHTRNRGVSAARNSAILAAKGDWLVVLDADDWLAPDRLGKLIRSGEERGLDAVIDNLERVDAFSGVQLGTAFPQEWLLSPRPLNVAAVVMLDVPYHQVIGFGYCKPIFRHSAFREKVGLYNERLHCAEDLLALQTMLFRGGRVGTFADAMYFYSVNPRSISNKPGVNMDVSRVNRLLRREAKSTNPLLLPFLDDRQVVIDYDALTKAFRQKRLAETVYFLFRIPIRVLLQQILRVVGTRLSLDMAVLDPRCPEWLKSLPPDGLRR